MLLFIIITSQFIASCEKSNERCENSHCDVLTCKIDGVSWAPYCESSGLFGCSAINVRYYKGRETEYINILCSNPNTKEGLDIFVYLYNEIRPEVENRISPLRAYTDVSQTSGCTFYHIDSTLSHQFTLYSFDYDNRIIEGTFFYSAINECDSTDITVISDGYFNLSY